ncbi:MAG: pilus assembly protein PilZ [Gammaproteobacteria bacterium]
MHNIQFLVIKDEVQLLRMYMPFLRHGGLFIPDLFCKELGQQLFLVLQLPDDPGRIAVTATAVWMSPAGVSPPQLAGTGFHFRGKHEQARARIEACLGAVLDSGQTSFTL